MAINYPLTLPTDPKPIRFQLSIFHPIAVNESPFTGQEQTQEHPGERWLAELAFDPMERADAEPWLAILSALRGRKGSFLLPAYGTGQPLGNPQGSPVVDGAGQSGQTLATRNWTASKNGLLLPGDYIQLDTGANARLYKVLTQVDSDGLGEALIDIAPRLRISPADGLAVQTSNTEGVFRLAENLLSWDIDAVLFHGFGFSAREVI